MSVVAVGGAMRLVLIVVSVMSDNDVLDVGIATAPVEEAVAREAALVVVVVVVEAVVVVLEAMVVVALEFVNSNSAPSTAAS
jgi:heme/copper-type cytochrome/quinol oxidase subunit 2